MKPRPSILVVLALLIIAGCRSDPAIPILERELRLREDEIYRLRAALDEMHDCGPTYGDRVVGGSDTSDEPARPRSRRPNGPPPPNGLKPPPVEMPSQSTTEFPKALDTPAGSLGPGILDPPKHLLEPSRPLGPPADGSRGRSSHRPSERKLPPGVGEPDGPALERGADAVTSRSGRITMASQPAGAVPLTPSGDSRRVAAIVLNRALTGGINTDDAAGDQGLLVVIEPRDRTGRSVDAPAEVSVVVLDPALEGDAARVARWDFTPAETAAMFRRTGPAAAIHLTTAWSADPPVHNKLHLFVRYVTADGRKLQTDQPIEVALAGDKTTRWNPSDRPASEPRQPPTARVPGRGPRMATRSDETKPRRPVWSPER